MLVFISGMAGGIVIGFVVCALVIGLCQASARVQQQ
jgi:hypothetical protein